MKKRIWPWLLGLSACILLVLLLTVFAVNSDLKKGLESEASPAHTQAISDEALMRSMLKQTQGAAAVLTFDKGQLVTAEQPGSWSVSMPEAGDYVLYAQFSLPDSDLFDRSVTVSVNDKSCVSQWNALWATQPGAVEYDRYGGEILPGQYQLAKSVTRVDDSAVFSGEPFLFHFEAGENTITVAPESQRMLLYGLYVAQPQNAPDYAGYLSAHEGAAAYDDETIVVEGENIRLKSDSYIRGKNIAGAGVFPQSAYYKQINATDDKSNKAIGQRVLYEVEAPQDGFYALSVKYCQPLKAGGLCYRTIEIDGETPFSEFANVGFAHTGIDQYENFTIGGDQPLTVYLEKGPHTIAFYTTAAPVDEVYRQLLAIVNEINDTGIEMKKIRGSSSDAASSTDVNRTWDTLKYIPDILERLDRWQTQLTALYDELERIGGTEPSYASDIQLAVQNLKRLAEKPREIPNKIALLSDDSSSAAQLVSLVLTKLYDQNLSIDRIYLHAPGAVLPSPKANLIDSLTLSLKRFVYSFSAEMNESETESADNAITVWINKPSQYVDALRELTAQEFTKQTGIAVTFSVMPDEKKITLANSTGSNPDVALGLSYYRPAEFAMRGMAKNLLEYDDFVYWYGAEYNLTALTPMVYDQGIYGASETQDFYVLFYRTDILDSLGLEVPQTWEDVKAMMPTLQRNAMSFNLTLANNVGYKAFEATSGFVFQNGGSFYSEDGLSAGFQDPSTIKALREMTNLYLVYGLSQNVPNFFNAFRSGSVPIGVSNFATYLQLQQGAPELNGRWNIALVPGTLRKDGVIDRSWSADTTSAMIFNNTKHPDEAYAFLKWWLSSKTQLDYATTLRLKYGSDYIWNTANLVALKGMPYPKAHLDVIREQWSWQQEVLRHPASYIIEREVSNAWIAIVTKGEPFQPNIDQATMRCNSEIRRKLVEFGYLDENGNTLKTFNIHLIDEIIAAQKGGQ
ncbi:MAG TPA: extracellular solute-binding protein [Candidatus Cryosericum sp.]|nr:extracellular solute-binding protein [Candidatus Cryosericum sp.]